MNSSALKDIEALKDNCTWLRHKQYVFELKKEGDFKLDSDFREIFPKLSALIELARVTHLTINGQPHLLFAWDDARRYPFGWLCEQQPESNWSSNLIHPHKVILRNIGGIRHSFHRAHVSYSLFPSIHDTFIIGHNNSLYDRYGQYYEELCQQADVTPLDITRWVIFVSAGNGDYLAYNPEDERIFIFAHDFGFGFNGITPVEGQPEMTLYTLDEAAFFRDFTERIADIWEPCLRFVSVVEPDIPLQASNPDSYNNSELIKHGPMPLRGTSPSDVIKRALWLGLVHEDDVSKVQTVNDKLHVSVPLLQWLIGSPRNYMPAVYQYVIHHNDDPDALTSLRQTLERKYIDEYNTPLGIEYPAPVGTFRPLHIIQYAHQEINEESPPKVVRHDLSFSNHIGAGVAEKLSDLLPYTHLMYIKPEELIVDTGGNGESLKGIGKLEIFLHDSRKQTAYILAFESGNLEENPEALSLYPGWDKIRAFTPIKIKVNARDPQETTITSLAVYNEVAMNFKADHKLYGTFLRDRPIKNHDLLMVQYNYIRHLVIQTANGRCIVITKGDLSDKYEIVLNPTDLIAEIERCVQDVYHPLQPLFYFKRNQKSSYD
jgi:hypothetical protein